MFTKQKSAPLTSRAFRCKNFSLSLGQSLKWHIVMTGIQIRVMRLVRAHSIGRL